MTKIPSTNITLNPNPFRCSTPLYDLVNLSLTCTLSSCFSTPTRNRSIFSLLCSPSHHTLDPLSPPPKNRRDRDKGQRWAEGVLKEIQ
ncbi:hypothetical protein MIMGU_mgv1a017233mg [Erythranthe guttata]|uniref:Uncharacterized protein n=1 Tax=Erythranthe guttata TaxID=4155 RepID=A0A022R6E3_ERYGU|nr:hypothetical protein MIMGU_mgv1a017233mg [Erythranthe guttata]